MALASAACASVAIALATTPAQLPPLPHEVAPRVAEPAEPETRTLSPDEARDALVRDWLFQAEGRPLVRRARQEIGWARDLADRLAREHPGLDLSPELADLDRFEARCAGIPDDSRALPSRRAAELPEGLIGWWSFDGSLTLDGSGHRLDATLEGSPESDLGVFGSGLRLTGQSTLNVGPELSRLPAGPYTISAWIRTTDTEADIVGDGVGVGRFLFMTYQGVVRGHQWTAESGNVVDGKTRVNDGRWHHVAQVVDGRTIAVYVDGRLDGSLGFTGEPVVEVDPVRIGGRGPTGSSLFAGSLDEVCVFSRALADEEVAAEYNAGSKALRPADEAVEARAREFYLAVRDVKRRIVFANPAIDFDEVLFVDNPYPQGSEWPHQARHRNGMMAVPGGRLLVLEGLGPGGNIRRLAPERPAGFWRPDLSFDARKVLFCMKPSGEPSFHLYEIGIDGTGLRQLTDGPYDDLDPIYLPDGQIMFTSTRCNTYVRCMPYTFSYVLARCDADGGNVYLISQNSEPDWLPTLLNDGRVIYSRWEYTDKALWRIQSLWITNPDGTATAAYWGNQSVWPDHLAEPRPIPGSRRVMFTGLAHHNWFDGSIGILDQDKGFNFPYGLTKVTCDVPWPECGAPPVDFHESGSYHSSGAFTAYKTPYPLSETQFLVSARKDDRFALYLMDVDGNRELIYEGAYNNWHAMPVKPRPVPPRILDRVIWPGTGPDRKPNSPGTFFSVNVYEGVPALAGKARYVRVLQMDAKTYSTWERDARFSGPSISCFQEDGLKRILGTVPVEADGSVHFTAPAGVALHFQLLDEHYRALQTMRSFTGLMPGERRGCVGCHEMHSVATSNRQALALGREPSDIVPPPWGTATVSYNRMVQPILNRYCEQCHQNGGSGQSALDLTVRPSGVYEEPYVTLVMSGAAGALLCENYEQSDPASYVTSPPLEHLSSASRLVDIAMSGEHYGVKMDDATLQALIGWVDSNCPYRGEEDVRAIPDPQFDGLQDLGVTPLCAHYRVVPRP